MVQAPQLTSNSDPVLSDLVNRLVRYYDPESIYVFGSRARGDFRKYSDYDIMVIVPDSTPRDAQVSWYKATKGLRVNVDVKVWEKSQFGKQLHLKASMPSTVLREGQLLYLREGLAELNNGDDRKSHVSRVCEPDDRTSDSVLFESTRDWLEQARIDLQAAEPYILHGDTRNHLGRACFHSQQSIEKVLKTFLVWHDQPARHHHVLELLTEDCLLIDPSLEPVLHSVNWLLVWAVAGRYPTDTKAPTRQEAFDGLELARRVYQAIFERLPPEVSEGLEPL